MSKLEYGSRALDYYNLRSKLYFEKLFNFDQRVVYNVTNEKTKVSKSKSRKVVYLKFPHTKEFNNGNFVSIELLYFLIAKDFSFYETLIFGIEILSEELTNKRKIFSFLLHMKKNKGYKNACEVCKYLTSGSESIMETILFALIILPHSKGGFGIKNIIMNKKIKIPSSLKNISHRKYFVADFFIPNKNITIEYDSTKFHSDRDSLYTDANKRNITELLGYEVVTITSKQLYSYKNRMAIFLLLMKKINKRPQIRTKKFFIGNKKIENLLPKE